MRVRVRLFAAYREAVGRGETSVDLPEGGTVSDLLSLLVAEFPRLRGLAQVTAAAVNQEYVARSTVLHDGDEVAFIPPVSGGVEHVSGD